jgi:hypothetical protein
MTSSGAMFMLGYFLKANDLTVTSGNVRHLARFWGHEIEMTCRVLELFKFVKKASSSPFGYRPTQRFIFAMEDSLGSAGLITIGARNHSLAPKTVIDKFNQLWRRATDEWVLDHEAELPPSRLVDYEAKEFCNNVLVSTGFMSML